MRKVSAKWVPKWPNADQKRQRWQPSEQHLEFFWRDPNDFLSRLVTMDETWLYHYDQETKQQSMGWGHSGSPRPKKFRVQNPLENFSPQFFWIKTASSLLIIFERAKLSMRSITRLCWCNWSKVWKKKAGESSPRWSCFCTTMPRLTGHLQPKETGLTGLPMPWSPTLFSVSGPVGLARVPWTEKQLKVRHFSSVEDVIFDAETWLVGQLSEIFMIGLRKLEQRAKKCIELRGDYGE